MKKIAAIYLFLQLIWLPIWGFHNVVLLFLIPAFATLVIWAALAGVSWAAKA